MVMQIWYDDILFKRFIQHFVTMKTENLRINALNLKYYEE